MKVKNNEDRAANKIAPDVIPTLDKKFNVGGNHQYSGGATTVGNTRKKPKYVKDKPVIQCGKNDGRSWKCLREAARGHKLCEHHLSLVRKNNSNRRSIDKPQHHPGSKRASTSSSSNRNELYYYLDFRPRWGKKRERGSIGSNVPKTMEHGVVAGGDKKNEGESHIERRTKRAPKCVDRLNL